MFFRYFLSLFQVTKLQATDYQLIEKSLIIRVFQTKFNLMKITRVMNDDLSEIIVNQYTTESDQQSAPRSCHRR